MTFAPLLPGSGFASQAFTPAAIPAVHYDPRAAALGMDDVGAVGIGKGGQIYRIRVNGVVGDVVSSQNVDSHWVDGVVQSVATWTGIANPASGEDWHYHQAGTYSRGPLAGKPQFNSPILWNNLDPAAGVYEALVLAQQAHVDSTHYAPDRILCHTTYRRVGKYVIEVENVWINHTQSAMPGIEDGTTPLDNFNFPWCTFRHAALPFAQIELGNGARKDVSLLSWPEDNRKYMDRAVAWFGLFTSPVGVGIAVIPPQGGMVKLGAVTKQVIVENGKTAPPWTLADERHYIFTSLHNFHLPYGQMLAARWYLLVGVRPDQASAQAAVRRPQAIISAGDAPPLPTYRVMYQGQMHESEDPYLGDRSNAYLDGRYQVKGIL